MAGSNEVRGSEAYLGEEVVGHVLEMFLDAVGRQQALVVPKDLYTTTTTTSGMTRSAA